MAAALDSKPVSVVHEGEVTDVKVNRHPQHQLCTNPDAGNDKVAQTCISSVSPSLSNPEENLLPSCDTNQAHSTFYIYHKHQVHLVITPIPDPTKDRRSGPTFAEQKAKRLARKSRENSNLPPAPPDENAFYLHTPYLSFHCPPQVLYQGDNRNGTPALLVHASCFWREYKLQLGPTIAKVLDPRGVVGLRHNADAQTRKTDGTALKGYRIRGWRLWGETGKAYVHSVKKNRDAGLREDPDTPCEGEEKEVCNKAEEVVYLRWKNPFSKHTRCYSFSYHGVEFLWKGTGTVKEGMKGGSLMRYCHLKLVARIPLPLSSSSSSTANAEKKKKGDDKLEICLGKYTSSMASKKSGMLVLYDETILRLVEEHMPEMLGHGKGEDIAQRDGVAHEEIGEGSLPTIDKNGNEDETAEGNEVSKVARLKKSMLYLLIIATGLCMIMAEKEKRHTIMDILLAAAEGGGGAGG